MSNNQGQTNNIFSENKGRGLFYGVIAIATFIVMAVGATFAYFTATTESMNAAVQAGSTTLQLQYISYGTAWSKPDLIPANTAVVEYSVEKQDDVTITSEANEEGVYPANGNNTLCKDDYGNSICSVYVFQVINTANSPQSVSLNVVSEINGFASLHAMAYEIAAPADLTDYNSVENGNGVNDPLFRTSAADDRENVIVVTTGDGVALDDTDYTPVYINRKGVVKTLLKYNQAQDDGTTAVVPAIDRKLVSLVEDGAEGQDIKLRTARIADDVEIDGGSTKTFALILYIKNEEFDQTDTDAEKTFQGQVIVSSGDGKTGVSGTIGLVTEEVEDQLQSNTQGTPNQTPGENGDPSGSDDPSGT